MDPKYGPPRPDPGIAFHQHRTQPYLQGKANKIRSDLAKWFRMYQGKLVHVYSRDKAGGRCTLCTDSITGASLMSNCPQCDGTGYENGYIFMEECWAMAEIEALVKSSSELGNTEMTRSGKDSFLFTSERLLVDTDIALFVDTREIYKLVDVEPKMVAMNGTVVVQAALLNRIPPGAKEYQILS